MREDNGKLLAEFSAVTAVAVTAFTAALLGTLFGLAVSRRLKRSDRRTLVEEQTPDEDEDLVSWTRLSRLEAELNESRSELDLLRRDYELDTGLLKQEIQRLELLLGRFTSGRQEQSSIEWEGTVEPGVRPGYHSLRLIDPLRPPAGTITFAPLASLESAPSEPIDSDGP